MFQLRNVFSPAAFLTLLALGTPWLFAQQPEQLYTATRLQLDVTKVVLAEEAAWNKGDLDGFLSHYKNAADTEAMLPTPVRGLVDIRLALHINFPSHEAMGTLENSEVDVRALGETFALATGHYRLTRSHKGGGNTEGDFTEIMEKTPAGWQVIFSATT